MPYDMNLSNNAICKKDSTKNLAKRMNPSAHTHSQT